MKDVDDLQDSDDTTSRVFRAVRDVLPAGGYFEPHFHDVDQLAWMATGSATVSVRGETWYVRRDHFVWLPAGAMHEMSFDEPSDAVSLYASISHRPEGPLWERPRVFDAVPLAGAVLEHLADEATTRERRMLCRQLLADLLRQTTARHDILALPEDPRARVIARALIDDPSDPRDLDQWAAQAGVSAKTIARAFLSETGMTFRAWRIQARLHAAAALLLGGSTVQETAALVGYRTTSSFITTFSSRFGLTPARYVQQENARRAGHPSATGTSSR